MPEGSEQQNIQPETTGSPEAVSAPKTPEAAPVPVSPEEPSREGFNDQATAAPVPQVQAPAAPPAPVDPAPLPDPTPDQLEDQGDVPELDKQWIEAVETVIEKNDEHPYEEEEDAEKLQIDYLAKRFGRKIGKDE